MKVSEAIRTRRSVKQYEDTPISRERIEPLLEAVCRAPNHRSTEPWEFYVLGPDAQRVYAEVRAEMKSNGVEDSEAAEAVRRKVEAESLEIPRMIAVASHLSEDPEIREEDYAAVWMGIQNLLLLAWDEGIGSYIRTGRILEKSRIRSALGVPDDQRIVAFIQLGRPAEVPEPKPRIPAADKTCWLE